MVETRTSRRLAAILAADVVGYSRLMAKDEAGTLAALKLHRESVFDPAVARHNGRIVKLIGDGTLVEFASVVDAVNCALAIQTAAMDQQAAGGSIALRIGINLGDIIIDGDDIYGDGVNVAARLEPLADASGICVSSIVNESVGNRIAISFEDGGEVHVKNIDRPIRIWKWHPDQKSAAAARQAQAVEPPSRPEQPSIAVLPFDNMSGDPEHEYFSDGMTEDIITDLSKIAGLLVVARNSSFAYKGKQFDIRNVARELGVRYVLEGSVRRAANRVRITAQLIDASTGGHLWAERFDREMSDIFAVQDEVNLHIVNALKVVLTPAEKALLTEGGTKSIEAHDCYVRARDFVFGATKDLAHYETTKGLLERAIEIDPAYAEAHAALGVTYLFDFINRWTDGADAALGQARTYSDMALAKGPNDAFTHAAASRVALYENDLERAASEAQIALTLNPNYALAYNMLGTLEVYSGRPLTAIPLIERAMRLDPGFSQQYLHFLGLAYLVAGKYETAAVLFRQRIMLVPETDMSRAFYASALGHLGEVEEARRIWHEIRTVSPQYAFEGHIGRTPFQNPADVAAIRAGLTKAGLPD